MSISSVQELPCGESLRDEFHSESTWGATVSVNLMEMFGEQNPDLSSCFLIFFLEFFLSIPQNILQAVFMSQCVFPYRKRICCCNSEFEGLGLAYLMSQFHFPDSQAELLCADPTSSAGFLWSSWGVSMPWTFSLGLVSFALMEGVEQDDL